MWSAESTRAQEPVVIGIRPQTEFEMMAKLFDKLSAQAPNRSTARGVNPSSACPGHFTIDAPSAREVVAGMTKKLCMETPPQVLRCGIRPPPGLSLPDNSLAALVPGSLQPKVDVDHFRMQSIYGFSKVVDAEQSSTNDDGDHEACESWPSEEDSTHLQEVGLSPGFPGGMTTLMVRNVPVMYTQEMLLLEWEGAGAYDFLYLPRTGQTNLSYAFINFVSEAHAMAFKAQWHKKRMAHFTARKPLNISFADVQGLKANLVQLKKKRVRRIEMRQCQPFIIKNGRQLDLTEALAVMEH